MDNASIDVRWPHAVKALNPRLRVERFYVENDRLCAEVELPLGEKVHLRYLSPGESSLERGRWIFAD